MSTARSTPCATRASSIPSCSSKDLETVESRIGKCQKQASAGDKTAKRQYDILVRYREALEQGLSARTVDLTAEERKAVADLNLLTDKPVLYVCNVDEKSASTGNAHTEAVRRAIEGENAEMLIVAAATEADIAELESYDERQMFACGHGTRRVGRKPPDKGRLPPARLCRRSSPRVPTRAAHGPSAAA